MPSLIVNADDFGRTAAISRGIIDTYKRGIVTSTTVMVNYPDAAAGLDEALRAVPDLGLGVHLTLTSGQPVSPPEKVPTLVDDNGWFHKVDRLSQVYARLDAEDLCRELTAQVERFILLTGKPPDHLDSHHHAAFMHPAALRATLDLALKYNIPVRKPYPGNTPEEAAKALSDLVAGLSVETALGMSGGLRAVLDEGRNPSWPDTFETRFYGPNAILGELLLMLVNLPDGVTELMCHPGYAEGLEGSAYAAEREREIEALTHPSVKEVLIAQNIRLMNFSEMPR